MTTARLLSRLRRLPRVVFWIVGAVIAAGGAITARSLADQVDGIYRVPIWLSGASFVFIGLAIVSMGTKAFLEDPDKDDGAGEGNRTLA